MAFFKRNVIRGFLLLVLALLAVWLIRVTDARLILKQTLNWISELGPWAPFWFVLVYIVACLVFFPGFILNLGAGIIFGLVWGTFLVSIGATIGAGLAFLISRYVARGWILRRFAANPRFRDIDEAVAKDGWKIVGLIRLSPVFPFIPTNFLFGLTKIPFWQFFFVTWIAIIPMTAFFVYLGSLLGEIAAIGTQPIGGGRIKWLVSLVGVAATLVVTVLVTRVARRALTERLPEEG